MATPATPIVPQSGAQDPAAPALVAPAAIPSDDQAVQASIEAYTQQELNRQNGALQANIAAAARKNPDIAAEAQRIGMQVGVGPDIAERNMDVVRRMATVQSAGAMNLPQTAPRLAELLKDPQFSGVAYDDLGTLASIEQGAQAARAATPPSGFGAEARSLISNTNRGFYGAIAYPLNAVGTFAEDVWKSGSPLANYALGLDPEASELRNIWTTKAPSLTTRGLDAAVNSVSPPVFPDQPQYVRSASGQLVKNPNYRWWGRPLVDTLEQVPGQLAAFMLTGRVAGAAGGEEATAENLGGESANPAAAAPSAAERQIVPALLSGQGAQTTYAQARAHGADQKAAILAALASGLGNYTLMGQLPGPAPASSVGSALGQWAQRSVAMGAGMAVTQNTIARGYDPEQSLWEGLPQSIATMAAYEGAGTFPEILGHISDQVAASKLMKRAPDTGQRLLDAEFEGDPSLRVPAQDFVNYFAGRQIDPAEAAARVGVTNLDEAAAAGADLEIPRANFFGRLDPEHQKGLQPYVIDPATGLTSNAREGYQNELQTAIGDGTVQKLVEEYAQADAETQATPEWKKVQADLKQRYLGAGETETAAEDHATLGANAMAYFAKGARLKPDELLALHNPVVTAGAPPDTVLYQSGAESGEGEEPGAAAAPQATSRRKARNLEAAQAQGEFLKAASEPPAESEAERRGWFRILGPGQYEIGKTKIGDLSTFIHEPAHAYLEMYRELTQRPDASDALKEDFSKIANWLGTTPEEAQKNGFTREQHEQWASANEQYVREGKAPTSGLRRAFQHFAVWMTSIYHRASRLGVEISPDVRGVMDRLYGGEDAVHRAAEETERRPLFASPEEAGWTEEEYRKYAEATGTAEDKAREQVRAEMNAAAEREHDQEFREERSNVRDAVTEEVDARPEYRAIRSLRRGRMDDGTELTLNRDALARQFGEERVQALQQLHRGLYRNEGGTDAETAGELLGYGSGEEMMRALEAAPRRSQAIEAATRDYLVNKYGDVRYDGTLNDRARFAIENDERAGNIYRELRTLRSRLASVEKKSADTKAVMAAITLEPLEHYQEAARQMIDQKAIADLQPYRYLEASRRFSRDAFDALRKGNARAAADAKNKELLNHFLFREASAARDYVDKFEKYAQRVQSRGIQQRLGLADQNAQQAGGVGDYRDQFNWLLARYNLRGMDIGEQPPARSLRDWADEMQSQGRDTAIALSIANSGAFRDYRSVPLSEVRDLHDALTNIRHLALQEFKMYVQGKQVDFAEARAAMVKSARDNLKSRPETIFPEDRTALERAGDALKYGDAMLMRMERLMEWMDGGKQGPWHDNIWNLAADAQGDEYGLQEQVTKPILDELEKMPESMRKRMWEEKVAVEGIPQPITRRRMVSMAMNMGNEGNLDRLRKTFIFHGWDPGAVERIGGMLSREEWQFVQKTWDSLKPIGQRMNDLEKRLTGLAPKMVTPTPLRVALDDGTEMELAGGYFPIRMDPRYSQRAVEQDSRETAQNVMQSGYVRATTSRGYTKERTGFGGPLDLDFERALSDHLSKAVKDLSHREFMLSSQRLLLDTEIRKALRETLGTAYEKQFMPWLRTIINDRNGSTGQGLEALSDAMQTLRSNIVAAELGFKVSTSLLQLSHMPRMMLYARPGSLAQALVDFLARPMEVTRENQELSPNEMRFRGDNLNRDIRAVLNRPEYKAGYERKVAVAARFALAGVDHLFSHTLWRAAYRDGLTKYSELPLSEAQSKAVHEADSAVRLGLGTSAPKDLPAIMRNNDFTKMITVLYGFHNGVYGQLRDMIHQVRYDRNVAKLTYTAALTAIAPALVGAVFTGYGPKDGENVGLWAAKKSLLFSADTIPFLRSVTSLMDGGRDVQFTPIESAMEKAGKAAMEAGADKPDKDWLGIGLDATQAAGTLFGVPGSQQVVKTLRYAHRASEGRVANPNWWNAIAGGGY